MALNITSTTGLLGGHTWRYGSTNDDRKAEAVFSVTDGDAGNAWVNANTGDYIEITSTSGVTQNFIFSRRSGSSPVVTGVAVAAGDNIGNSRKSNVAGITIGLANSDQEADTLTGLKAALEDSDSTLKDLITAVQVGDDSTDGQVTLTFTQEIGGAGNTTIKAYTWSAGTANDGTNTNGSANPGTPISGTWTDLEQTFPFNFSGGSSGKLTPFEDELVIEGKFVNTVAGSNEKAGLTRVNNSTALTDPTTTADATQLGRARDIARAFLAYKKKKK